jgi:retron-type reverse transcriptase
MNRNSILRLGLADSLGRVVRGGSWNNDNTENFRCANRNNNDPTNRNDNNGFRVASTSMPEFLRPGAKGACLDSPGRFQVHQGRIPKPGGAAGSRARTLRRRFLGAWTCLSAFPTGRRADIFVGPAVWIECEPAGGPASLTPQADPHVGAPTGVMRRVNHLFDLLVSFENLLGAAREAARGKRGKPAPAAFQFDLEPNLLRLHAELASGTYRPGPYHTFRIRDPKPRLISAAPYRDRVVHHAVCRVIEPVFERGFIFDSYACRRDKGTHRALDRATAFARRSRYALKCDVAKFFPSIDHAVLLSRLARRIKCRPTLDLLRVILAGSNPQEPVHHCFPGDDLFSAAGRRKGIPIGNLTSQFFGNVMLDPLDHFLKEEKRCRGYVRYADDFMVFGDDKAELHAVLVATRGFLADYRLALHPHKCQVFRVADGVPFLGWQVFPDHRRLRRATGVRIQRGLRRLAEAYGRGEVDLPRVRASVASWIGFLRHGDAWGLLTKLLAGTAFVRSAPASSQPSNIPSSHALD